MNKITALAQDRCERKSLQEQLEDCRRQMQRDSGAGDMGDITDALNHDSTQAMRLDGAD